MIPSEQASFTNGTANLLLDKLKFMGFQQMSWELKVWLRDFKGIACRQIGFRDTQHITLAVIAWGNKAHKIVVLVASELEE